jgi:PAS domain S-box-containing protein
MERARDTGAIVASPPGALIQGARERDGLLIFRPVYSHDAPHDTLEERRASISGYVLAVVRIEILVERSLEDFPVVGIDILLYDETDPAEDLLLYTHQSRARMGTARSTDRDRAELQAGLHRRAALDIPGRQWSLLFLPSPEFIAAHNPEQTWLILAGGLLFTAIIGAYLLNRIGHATEIEELATSLSKNNEGLASEILERERANAKVIRLVREEATLAEIGRIMTSSLRIDDVYERFAEQVRQLIPYDQIAIDTIDMESNELRVEYVYGAGAEAPTARRGSTRPLAGSAAEDVLRVQSGILSLPREKDDLQDTSPRGLPSFGKIDVPLIARDESLGMLSLMSTQSEAYTEQDLELAKRVAAQISGAIANARLLAQHRLAEEELRLQATVLASAANGIVVTDSHGVINWVNPAFTSLTGYTAQEAVGLTTSMLRSGRQDDGFYRDLWKTILSGNTWRGELINRRKDGSLYPEEQTITPVRDEQGSITNFISIKQDISERKAAEDALAQRTDDLARSNQALEDFANVASHDLQEPLRKVRAFGDLLRSKSGRALDDQGGDYLDRMQGAAARMQTLITDLLSLSRVTTQGQPLVSVDLNVVTHEVLSDLVISIEESGGEVEVGALPTIEADPTQMQQLLQNLVGNALKYHRDGVPPVVKIRSRLLNGVNGQATGESASEDFCEITVADNGIGFDEIYAERIFTVFQRLHGRESYDGTGIGLAICRKIAERHGGHVTATSCPESGSTFTVTLPILQGRAEKAP